jgi:Skp family chaperone for outer membrane proteins
LKKTSEANGYAYVLAYSAASSVLYGGKTLDITNDVVAELNSQK